MRLFIYGSPGAGKTTVAMALAAHFGLQSVHLDEIFFDRQGQSVPLQDAVNRLGAELQSEHWIVEGHHGAAIDICAACADRIIVLRLGRWRSLGRAVHRALRLRFMSNTKASTALNARLPLHLMRYIHFVHPQLEVSHLNRIRTLATCTVEEFADIESAIASA